MRYLKLATAVLVASVLAAGCEDQMPASPADPPSKPSQPVEPPVDTGPPPLGPNSCELAYNGKCDERLIPGTATWVCPIGTDTWDCRGLPEEPEEPEEPEDPPDAGLGLQPLPWDDPASKAVPECITVSRKDSPNPDLRLLFTNSCDVSVTVYYCRSDTDHYRCGDGMWASYFARAPEWHQPNARTRSMDAVQPYYTDSRTIPPAGTYGARYLYGDLQHYAVCRGWTSEPAASTGEFYYYGPDQFRSDSEGRYGCYPSCPNGSDGSPGCRGSCQDVETEPWSCPVVPEEYNWSCCSHCEVPKEGYPPPCHPKWTRPGEAMN